MKKTCNLLGGDRLGGHQSITRHWRRHSCSPSQDVTSLAQEQLFRCKPDVSGASEERHRHAHVTLKRNEATFCSFEEETMKRFRNGVSGKAAACDKKEVNNDNNDRK